MQLLLVFGIVAAIAAVAFALQNSVTVTVSLGLWSFDSSLAMVLLLALGIGASIALLISWPGIIKNVWKGSRMRRQINKLEDDKATLEQRVTQLEEELTRISPEPIPEEPSRFLGLKALLLGSEVEKSKE